jgi:hypothetical protein
MLRMVLNARYDIPAQFFVILLNSFLSDNLHYYLQHDSLNNTCIAPAVL